MVLQQGIITLPCTCCLETEYVETKYILTSIYNNNPTIYNNNSTIYIHQMQIMYMHKITIWY